MAFDEALKVLRLPTNYTRTDVEKQFDRFFTANDAAKGGSLYLQCKFIAAKETALEELAKRKKK